VSCRVVLYAEGVGDVGGEVSSLPPPTETLAEFHLGPAHALVRRCIARETSVPEQAVTFLSPLRPRGRHARGSDLHDRNSLRQLLTWPNKNRRPDLAVVLVDGDGRHDRRSTLREFVDGISTPHVVGVAIQEFEAWLIADHGAVVGALSPAPEQPSHVESLSPRQAKTLLGQWISTAGDPDGAGVRLTLARTCNLTVLDRLSAFQSFRQDLRSALDFLETT
jgi:hypothetical protein